MASSKSQNIRIKGALSHSLLALLRFPLCLLPILSTWLPRRLTTTFKTSRFFYVWRQHATSAKRGAGFIFVPPNVLSLRRKHFTLPSFVEVVTFAFACFLDAYLRTCKSFNRSCKYLQVTCMYSTKKSPQTSSPDRWKIASEYVRKK